MNYPWIHSGSTELSIQNDIIQLRTEDLNLQLPVDALIRCAFLEADENGSRGYLKFTMDGQTSVMASFDRRNQADFQAAYQAVNRRMEEMKKDRGTFRPQAGKETENGKSVSRPPAWWILWVLLLAVVLLMIFLAAGLF